MRNLVLISLLVYALAIVFSAYTMPVSVDSVCGNEIVFKSADGNLWSYKYDHDVNESVMDSDYVLVMSNQFTDSILDDEILCVL